MTRIQEYKLAHNIGKVLNTLILSLLLLVDGYFIAKFVSIVFFVWGVNWFAVLAEKLIKCDRKHDVF